MKRFLVCAALSAVMFFMVSCGGSDSNNNKDNGNGENIEENNNGNGNTEENGNGENTEENNNDNSSTEDNSGCTKITPKWTEAYYDYEYEEEEMAGEFVLAGTYSPKTGTNPDYGDAIDFWIEYSGEPKNEYDFASTIDAGVYVLEDYHESDYEETGHDNEWDRAYIAVSGTVTVNDLDVIDQHASISLQNVKLMEATLNREDEDGTWTW